MSNIKNCKILIVGAGPSGTSASMFLSKAKIPHVIIDKAVFPRDKICGDALSGKVVDIFKRLDNGLLEAADNDKERFIASWGVKFVAPNVTDISIPFTLDRSKSKFPPGFITKRLDFDSFLVDRLDKEYAELITQCSADDIIEHEDNIEVKCKLNGENFTIYTELLVSAEGTRSITAKKLAGHKMEPKHHCAGIRAYYKGVEGMHPENFIELHFLKELLPGYFWIFPLPNGEANVGVGMLTDSVSKGKVDLKKLMEKAIKENPSIKERFKNAEVIDKMRGWGLPLGSKKRKLSGNRYILLGDAGSLIDPFTGEGIGNAMLSGMVASRTIEKAVKENRYDAALLKEYDSELYKKVWGELRVSHIMQRLTKYPWLFNFVVRKISKSKTLQDTIMFMFEDVKLRAKFKNPMFYLKMIFNR